MATNGKTKKPTQQQQPRRTPKLAESIDEDKTFNSDNERNYGSFFPSSNKKSSKRAR